MNLDGRSCNANGLENINVVQSKLSIRGRAHETGLDHSKIEYWSRAHETGLDHDIIGGRAHETGPDHLDDRHVKGRPEIG